MQRYVSILLSTGLNEDRGRGLLRNGRYAGASVEEAKREKGDYGSGYRSRY